MANPPQSGNPQPNTWLQWREVACGIALDALPREAWSIFAGECRPWDLVNYVAWQGWTKATAEQGSSPSSFEASLRASIQREVDQLRAFAGGLGA
ncbi:MAG: hypothetical protein ABR540_05495 [Acidimicrobiales bacterium]